ncbi:regulator of chromosome condensation 1/beta-lactamase-inhibitor protein II [Spinellus fusiger]|nr:regulator of chromosome condensation 1/beta-lactamase-inhibitor protein II [Spinellus fusiger]
MPLTVLSQHILPLLDVKTLLQLQSTCRTFYALGSDEYLWKQRVCWDYNYSTDLSFRHKGWKVLYSRLEHAKVYTWGQNEDRRLGHPLSGGYYARHSQTYVSTPKELISLRGKGIVTLLSGGWSFHALDKEGRVWMWGTMQQEYDGIRSLSRYCVEKPTLVGLPPGTRILSLSCGRSHAIALDDNNNVWQWNNCWKVQRVVFPFAVTIAQVSANWKASVVLSSTGTLYTVPLPPHVATEADNVPDLLWEGAYFSLDRLLQDPTSPQATEVVVTGVEKGDFIVQVAGLETCVIALSLYGKIFKIATENPALLESSLSEQVALLAPFSSTTQENNRRHHKGVRRCVSGAFKQFAVYTTQGPVMLGHQNNDADAVPLQREALQDDICNVSFGDYHTGALTHQGTLLTWGSFSAGALGHGDNRERDEESVSRVDALANEFVFGIGFGGWQSGALTISKE